MRTRIVIDNKSSEQVSHLTYIRRNITYDVNHDVDRKFHSICGKFVRHCRGNYGRCSAKIFTGAQNYDSGFKFKKN